jgi:hypothetical protein
MLKKAKKIKHTVASDDQLAVGIHPADRVVRRHPVFAGVRSNKASDSNTPVTAEASQGRLVRCGWFCCWSAASQQQMAFVFEFLPMLSTMRRNCGGVGANEVLPGLTYYVLSFICSCT